MPSAFFYKLRQAECEKLIAAFKFDLDTLLKQHKLKGNTLDNIRKVLAYNLEPATEVIEYLQEIFAESRKEGEEKKDILINPDRLQEALDKFKTRFARTQEEKTQRMAEIRKLDEIVEAIKQTSGTKNIGLPIKNFHGTPEEDIDEYISNFEKISKINEWDEKTKIKQLTKHLQDGAYTFLLNDIIGQNEQLEWTRIIMKLQEKYKKDEDDWELIISKMKQEYNEDAPQYAQKIERICKKINPNMSAQAIISKILHGLQPRLRSEILHRDITTTADLHRNLQQIQKNFSRYDDTNTELLCEIKALRETLAKPKGTNEEEKQKKRINEPEEAIHLIPQKNGQRIWRKNQQQFQGRGNQQNPRQYYGRPPNNFTYSQAVRFTGCSFCKVPTHNTIDCRKRQRFQLQNTACYTCGKLGHRARECRSTRRFQPREEREVQHRGRSQFQSSSNTRNWRRDERRRSRTRSPSPHREQSQKN